jgi:hypothetical protein
MEFVFVGPDAKVIHMDAAALKIRDLRVPVPGYVLMLFKNKSTPTPSPWDR